MRTPFFWLCGAAIVAAVSGVGQPKRGSLEGVWQAVEVKHTGDHPMTITPGPNLTLFSAKHYSRIDVQSAKPRPSLANPASATAEQLREVWGPLVAEAGSYEIDGNLVTLRPIVSKNPAAMAPDAAIAYSYQVTGDTLMLRAEREFNGPVTQPFTVKLTRVE